MLAAQRPPFQRVARIRRTCRRSQSTAAPSIESSRVYCQNLLRTHDYASFLQAPFIPSGARDAHLAIRALNVELALIPDTVSNQNARTMRMQFWKDAVEDSFKGAPKAEPVSILLANVLANRTRLTKSFFQTMISERVVALKSHLTDLVVGDPVTSPISKHRRSRNPFIQDHDSPILPPSRVNRSCFP